MLPAAHRLRRSADFRTATRRGIKAASGCVVVYLAPASDPGDRTPARVGVVVSRVVGGSVDRHRAARRIRAAVRPHLAGLPDGSHVVIRALPGAADDPTIATHVDAGLQRVLRRLA